MVFKLPGQHISLQKILFGTSSREESIRKSHILNIILISGIFLSLAASVNNIIRTLPIQDSVSEILPGIILVFMYGLYITSRYLSSRIAALALVGTSSLLSYYLAYQWGTILQQSWILLTLSIVIAGILISSRFVIWLILKHAIVFSLLTYLQIHGVLHANRWDSTPEFGSVIVGLISISVIGLVSWLSNREIEKALHRARKSERVLKKERDLLELRVEERTKELRGTQLEKMAQLYRFADFGRLSAGLFHDFVNPLTAVSLNLEQLGKKGKSLFVKRALEGVRRMESFIVSARKQIQNQEAKGIFVLDQEITGVVNVLASRAGEAGVDVSFLQEKGYEEIRTFGNPIRFHQLVSNLVLNAIDAYEGVNRPENRKVVISLSTKSKEVELIVQDFGVGISKKNLGKIFEPFFTTKAIDKGMGIGLSLSKDIVEKNFGGRIKVKSIEGEGTIFTVDFPIREAID